MMQQLISMHHVFLNVASQKDTLEMLAANMSIVIESYGLHAFFSKKTKKNIHLGKNDLNVHVTKTKNKKGGFLLKSITK